jgi:group I intron endonuclease
MEENNQTLWEEKNLIEPQANCESNQISAPKDTIKEINQKLTENQWSDIGKTSGIYKIINKINGKYYLGSTKNFKNRWKRHIKALKNNTHINKHLQNAWNKYGENSFEFTIIENNINYNNLLDVEQTYLDNVNINECYNNSLNAHSPNKDKFGPLHPLYGKPLSQETKSKLSRALKGKPKSIEHRQKISQCQIGRAVKDETKIKISIATKCKWVGNKSPAYDHTIYKFYNINTNQTEICTKWELKNKFKLNRGNLYSYIRGNKRYKHIKGWIVIN